MGIFLRLLQGMLGIAIGLWVGALTAVLTSSGALALDARHLRRRMRLVPAVLLRSDG